MARVSVRSKLRQLPAERRRDVLAALHEGRAAQDPRDASLVVELAERPARLAGRWPLRIWIQPRSTRDRVERAFHAVTFPFGFAWAAYRIWSGGLWWHWLVPAWIFLMLTSTPAYFRAFRALRNAPAALAANQDATA